MYQLNDQQIDFIQDDIRAHGIRIESLQQNLLDHICILIEEGLGENGDFEKFYATVIRAFYKRELCEIEEETIFLLDCKGPHVLLSRSWFFVLLFAVVTCPFFIYDLIWLLCCRPAGVTGIPVEVWGGSLVLAIFPLLVLLVLLLTPERFDPVIPRGSKVLLGVKPFIKILPPEGEFAG